jgi:hypothetical protein
MGTEHEATSFRITGLGVTCHIAWSTRADPSEELIPADYKGKDFYGEEFTDAKIRDRWSECKKRPECAELVMARAKNYVTYEERETGTVDPVGKIDPHGNVDLAQIRRPAYFGRAPYEEPIAQSKARLYGGIHGSRDSYEQSHLKLTDPIKLRGWYLQGEGIGSTREPP